MLYCMFSYYLVATHRRSKERYSGPPVHTNVGKYATQYRNMHQSVGLQVKRNYYEADFRFG